MVAAYRQTRAVGWLGVGVGGRLALSVHLSYEPSELSHGLTWPSHDDSATLSLVLV